MNLQQIREKYPQYGNVSDDVLAQGLHKKYYPDLDFADFSNKIGYQTQKVEINSNLQPLTDEQKAQAKSEAERIRPKREGLKLKDVLDVAEAVGKGGAYAGSRILNGATLGATDWLDRKFAGGSFEQLGNEVAQNAKNGGKAAEIGNTIGNLAAEIGGNIAGAGGAIYKAGQKAGLKGLKLAMGTGAIEGAGYGATESDTLEELPLNVAVRAGLGAIVGAVGDKIAAPILNKGLSLGSKEVDFAKQTLNNYQVKRGVGKLTKMLERGKGFEDVSFGKISDDMVKNINSVPELEKIAHAQNGKIIIPKEKVEHIWERRVLGENVEPKNIAEVLKNVVHGEGANVSRGSNNFSPMFSNTNQPSGVSFVVPNANQTGRNEIHNVIGMPEKKVEKMINKNAQEGRPTPSYGRDLTHPAGQRFSGPQSDSGIVSQNGGVVNKDVEKATKYLEAELGADGLDGLIADMQKHGRTAIEVGDNNLVRMAQKARQKTPEAGDVFENLQSTMKEAQHNRNYNKINDIFGKRTKGQNIDGIVEGTKNAASPIYRRLSKIGDLEKYHIKTQMLKGGNSLKSINEALDGDLNIRQINGQQVFNKASNLSSRVRVADKNEPYTSLGRYVKNNEFVQSQIKRIRKDPLFAKELKGAPDTDFRVLDQVKKNIDDMVQTAKRSGENDRVFLLEQQRKNLLDQIDEIVPQYRQARDAYEGKFKTLSAQKIGEGVFDNSTSAEQFARTLRRMQPFERQSAVVGARDTTLGQVGSRENEAVTFNKILGENNKNKLRLLLGKEQANKFIEHAKAEQVQNSNMNKILSGSQTSEKLGLRDGVETGIKIAKSPTSVVGELIDAVQAPFVKRRNIRLAKALSTASGDNLSEALQRLRGLRFANENSKATELARLLGAYTGATVAR